MNSEPIPGDRAHADNAPGLVPALTLVVWLACISVGLTGLLSPPAAPPHPAATQPLTQVVSVTLEAEPAPPAPPSPMAAAAPAVPLRAMAAVPTAALPSAAIAFAVPVVGPARLGAAAAAAPLARAAGPAVQRITYGQGQGRQPAPDYPPDAVAAGQQGTVLVRFSIDADGRVVNAWAAGPSPFPPLNQSAVAAVRDRWRFAPGAARLYEVPITFRLNTAG